MMPTEDRLTITEAAAYLGLSRRTLYLWREQNRGPRSWLLGDKKIVYNRTDLDAYLDERLAATARGNVAHRPTVQ